MAELLQELGADGGLLVKLPGWHYADAALPAGATSLPLRDALARCYDLRQPKPELLQLLQSKLQAATAASGGVAANGHAAGAGANGGAANGAARGGGKQGGGKKKGGKGGQQGGQQNGTAAAAAGHDDELCLKGCVVDKMEVRAWGRYHAARAVLCCAAWRHNTCAAASCPACTHFI